MLEEEWEDTERMLSHALTHLANVLDNQGKAAEARKLVDGEVVPLLVRQVLGSAATAAEVRAFNLEAAMTVPLPSVKCVAALGSWIWRQPANTAADRSCVMATQQRLLKRWEELVEVDHPHTIWAVRNLLSKFSHELHLDEVDALYIRHRSAPRSLGDRGDGNDPATIAFRLGQRFVGEA
jgi:hypothetical protein